MRLPIVNDLFICGVYAIYPRDTSRSSFLVADQCTYGCLKLSTLFMQCMSGDTSTVPTGVFHYLSLSGITFQVICIFFRIMRSVFRSICLPQRPQHKNIIAVDLAFESMSFLRNIRKNALHETGLQKRVMDHFSAATKRTAIVFLLQSC